MDLFTMIRKDRIRKLSHGISRRWKKTEQMENSCYYAWSNGSTGCGIPPRHDRLCRNQSLLRLSRPLLFLRLE